MSEGSLTTTFSAPPGLEVHTPPCLVQNEQVHARTGISAGSGSQVKEKEMFPQWHLPWINKGAISVVAAPNLGVADALASATRGVSFNTMSDASSCYWLRQQSRAPYQPIS